MFVAFGCTEGLAATLDSRILGAYNGAGAWQVFVAELGTSQEQMFVEMHEGMHHELQVSTSWGLVSAMASELGRRNYRAEALHGIFARMVDSCRTVHEMFATSLSSFVLGEDRAQELLLDNIVYSNYLRDAQALVPRSQAPSLKFHHAAVVATLRAIMCPASVFKFLDIGYEALTMDDVNGERNNPEARLLAYRQSSAATGWQPLLEEIAAEHPEYVGAFQAVINGKLVGEEHPAFVARRIFEEEVLLPTCYRHVESALNACGYPTIKFGTQSKLVHRVVAAVAAVDQEFAGRLQLVSQRRSIAEDGLEYDRQGLVLRDRMSATVSAHRGTSADRSFFAWDDLHGRSMFGVWLSSGAASKQWAFAPADAVGLPASLRGLVQVEVDPDTAVPRVVIATIEGNPHQVQRAIGEVLPLVVLTTHSSLLEAELADELSSAEPVFVVMDLPVAQNVANWVMQGLTVRMTESPLMGTTTELCVLAFRIDEAPCFVFLSLGGTTGAWLLSERLQHSHGEKLIIDDSAFHEHSAGMELAIGRVLASWHVLDQAGTGI